MSSGKFKPKFSGDRAMLALQRQLADDPGLIPEPSFKATPVIRPLLIRLCSVAALAAFVAWGVVSYSDVKKTAGIVTSTPAIVSKHVSAVDRPQNKIDSDYNLISQDVGHEGTPKVLDPPVAGGRWRR